MTPKRIVWLIIKWSVFPSLVITGFLIHSRLFELGSWLGKILITIIGMSVLVLVFSIQKIFKYEKKIFILLCGLVGFVPGLFAASSQDPNLGFFVCIILFAYFYVLWLSSDFFREQYEEIGLDYIYKMQEILLSALIGLIFAYNFILGPSVNKEIFRSFISVRFPIF